MKKIVIFYLMFIPLSFLCQVHENNNKIEYNFYSSKIDLFVIGEDHYEDDIFLKLSIINYIQKNVNVDYLIFELPSVFCEVLNQYVLDGVDRKRIDSICSLLNPKVSLKTKKTIEFVKEYNFKHDKKIKIKGVDIFSFDGLRRQMKCLKILFPKLDQINLPGVKKYILELNLKNKDEGKEIIGQLLKEYELKKEIYEDCLGEENAVIYYNCLVQIKYYYLFDDKKWDNYREQSMYTNLHDLIKEEVVALMICGGLHAMYKEEDTWYLGYPFTSMISELKKDKSIEVFSIVLEHYEKKIFRLFPEFNLLSDNLVTYFKKCNEKYLVFYNDNLNLFAKERCDMVIVQNNRFDKLFKFSIW